MSILVLRCFPRGVRWGLKCGSRTAAAPKPAPKSQKWKPHCGLSGLSSLDSQRRYMKHSREPFGYNGDLTGSKKHNKQFDGLLLRKKSVRREKHVGRIDYAVQFSPPSAGVSVSVAAGSAGALAEGASDANSASCTAGVATPSAVMPIAVWNFFTASVVFAPK